MIIVADMRLLLHFLLFLVGFSYATMPMHAAVAVAEHALEVGAPHFDMTAADSAIPHVDQSVAIGLPSILCPHTTLPTGSGHSDHEKISAGHCSTCLTCLPVAVFGEVGLAACPEDTPGLAKRLVSWLTVPLLRPPRIVL